MKIEPGFFKTRNGSKARVLCTDAPGNWPVVGYVRCRGNTIAITWDDEGRVYSNTSHEFDLIEPWRDEPVPEQTVTLSLSKLRELLIQASEDVGEDEPLTKEEADDWLIEEGILPAPAKQPVRVSCWMAVYTDRLEGPFASRGGAQLWHPRAHAYVYVTGTESVGPTEGDSK